MTQTTTIVVLVDDEDASDATVQRATDLGLERGARVILYDVGATAGPLESPLPTEFASDGPDKGVPPLLTAQDLDAAGQPILARRVRALSEAGIDAYGWLPEKDDAERLAEYARAVGAERVVAGSGIGPSPDDLRSAGLEVERV
jgi:nucleotide-binding universal stress UspA family protein